MRSRPPRSMILPRMVVTGPGVLEQIPAIIAELDLPERGLIVCDKNTLEIAGHQVIEYLDAGGHPMQTVVIEGANIEELDRVEALHQKTIEKNSNFENLTPKEKALHILDEIISSIQKNGKYDFKIDDEIISLDKEDFIVNFDSKENFAVAKRDEFIVFISTSRNKEMMAKGLVKDIARRLQTLRKERGYNPTDVLEVASILELDEESLEMIKEKNEELSFLVRVKKVNFEKSCKEYKDDDIDGQKIKISVE